MFICLGSRGGFVLAVLFLFSFLRVTGYELRVASMMLTGRRRTVAAASPCWTVDGVLWLELFCFVFHFYGFILE